MSPHTTHRAAKAGLGNYPKLEPVQKDSVFRDNIKSKDINNIKLNTGIELKSLYIITINSYVQNSEFEKCERGEISNDSERGRYWSLFMWPQKIHKSGKGGIKVFPVIPVISVKGDYTLMEAENQRTEGEREGEFTEKTQSGKRYGENESKKALTKAEI